MQAKIEEIELDFGQLPEEEQKIIFSEENRPVVTSIAQDLVDLILGEMPKELEKQDIPDFPLNDANKREFVGVDALDVQAFYCRHKKR